MVWHVPTTRGSNWLYFSNRFILLLGAAIPEQAFMQWGWRIPFIASAVLVIVGLYIRLKLHETPAFQKF